MFHYGFVEDTADPLKKGRLRLKIPTLVDPDDNEGAISPWVDVAYPFGQKPTIKKGDILLCVAVESGPDIVVVAFGQIFSAPTGVGSKAPLAEDYGPTEYSNTNAIELDPAAEQKLVIKVKGQKTSITIDASENLIEIDPGPNDVLLTPGGARMAVEGDPVEVQTSDGPAYGHITSGSAPMQARKIT